MHGHEVWLQYASDDLRISKLALDDAQPAIPVSLVLAQQAAEKALKGYLIFKKQPIVKTHQLIMLVNLCAEHDKEFETLLDYAVNLTPHVTVSRYPDNFTMIPDLTTAKLLYDEARSIVAFVHNKIS